MVGWTGAGPARGSHCSAGAGGRRAASKRAQAPLQPPPGAHQRVHVVVLVHRQRKGHLKGGVLLGHGGDVKGAQEGLGRHDLGRAVGGGDKRG